MKNFILLFLVLISLGTKAQVELEEFYSENQLKAILQSAKSPSDQLEAYGMLALHYKAGSKDSLAAHYLEKVKLIITNTKNPKLKARALWWDNRYNPDTIKAKLIIDWANSANLIEDKIVGYIELTRSNIHINLITAEQNILTARKLWDDWKADSVLKDSLKLKVLEQLAHVYVHKKDGIKAVSYLLPLQDYAKQDRNQALKENALMGLSNMYFEWPGQHKKATEWVVKYYEQQKKLNNPHKVLFGTYGLALQYANVGDTAKANFFFDEMLRLRDSIGASSLNLQWAYSSRYFSGMLSLKDYAISIDNNFEGRQELNPKMKAQLKMNLYSSARMLDSAKFYIDVYGKLLGDSLIKTAPEYKYNLAMYYMGAKQFGSAIPLLKQMKTKSEEIANISEVQELCLLLSRSYAGVNDFKNAYQFLDQAYQLKDSLEKLGGKEEVSLMEMQKQQELQTALFNEEKRVQAAEQARIKFRNRVTLYGLLGGLAIVVLIAGLLWRNSRQKQKANSVLQHTLENLKTAQSQLVQSEKMASLGELTAGIAHEIQNPLNFVNNFSEVSSELVDEMKEQQAMGNWEQAKQIAGDVKQNLDKILHHGKRADAIVKGMLQHSRTSTGQKEPTNLNELAEEYLRLAFHGLRAKDKSFNASINTDFGKIGMVEIIPQDIGRVLVNLLNNAFYAVNEKRKNTGNGYEPLVTVSTKKIEDKIELRVIDNANGIPKDALEKIFQPFYTTKPTGQGTGLGLSLSYDIIKAHGGELKVETKEGEGSAFIIYLPVNR